MLRNILKYNVNLFFRSIVSSIISLTILFFIPYLGKGILLIALALFLTWEYFFEYRYAKKGKKGSSLLKETVIPWGVYVIFAVTGYMTVSPTYCNYLFLPLRAAEVFSASSLFSILIVSLLTLLVMCTAYHFGRKRYLRRQRRKERAEREAARRAKKRCVLEENEEI